MPKASKAPQIPQRLRMREREFFPPTHLALEEPNGLLAYGGDLSPKRLLNAYQRGIFPWYDEEESPILWWSPAPRCVLPLTGLKISRSLDKTLRNTTYTVTMDEAFSHIITACATIERPNQSGTWINQAIVDAYVELHHLGYAHSVEVWNAQAELMGGLYGVSLGRVFFGESMVSLQPNASKIALVHLIGQLKEWAFDLVDCQVSNPHLLSLGAVEMTRESFESILAQQDIKHTQKGRWALTWQY